MIYTAIDTFYLTDEQLRDSPSRKDGIDEAAETALSVYGCDLIQESGILLRLYLLSSLPILPFMPEFFKLLGFGDELPREDLVEIELVKVQFRIHPQKTEVQWRNRFRKTYMKHQLSVG